MSESSNSPHRLPMEIIHPILLSAIQGDRKTATVLAITSKTIYSWVVPVLYSTVVLTRPRQAVAFADTLRRSAQCTEQSLGDGRRDPRFPRCALGAYVRRLWLGPTEFERDCTLEAWYWDHDRDGRHHAHFPIDSLLSDCTALRSLVTQHCPLVVDMEPLINCLPQTLESLCIFPCVALAEDETLINFALDVPSILRLTSLREVTFVHRCFSRDMEQRLESGEMPSLRDVTQVFIYPGSSPIGDQVLFDDVLADQFFRAMRRDTSSTCLRRNLVIVVHCDDEDIFWQIEDELLQGIDASVPGWEWPPHVTVCGKDGCDEDGELDETKVLYDDWLTRADPSSPCCVTLEHIKEHATWDLPLWHGREAIARINAARG